MAWPAAVLAARDPDAVVAVVTADQIMHPQAAFQAALEQGFSVAEQHAEALVTFVVPTTPHTGYGYLRRGPALPGYDDVCAVAEFKEKPDRATAAEYLASGDYWWNSGMFVWRARTCWTSSRRCSRSPTSWSASSRPSRSDWRRSTRS